MPSLISHKPSVTVVIDKPRQIRYNWQAACRFEETYGKSIPDAMSVNIGTRLITHLAWAGMLHDEPSLSTREVERRINAFINQDGNILDLSQELIKALVASNVIGKAKTEDTPETSEGNEPAGE